MNTDLPVAALRRCAESRCLDILDRIAKNRLPVGVGQTNRTVMHTLRVSSSNARLCRNLLSEQIILYCKNTDFQ